MTVPAGESAADPDAVLAALGLPAARATTRQSGYDATVWRADLADGSTVAIRLLRPGVPSDRELAALRLAADYGHPAPRVIATGRHGGRDAIVMSWCAGESMGDRLEAGADPVELGRLFGRTQAGLHCRLDDGTVLCHLDFQPFNVLVDDGAVTGIVDWSNARVADPAEDLAWTTVVLALGPTLLPQLAGVLADFGIAWRDGYAERLPFPDAETLRAFVRTAARRQQSDWAPRVAAGQVPDDIAAATEAIVASAES
jgi:aminoglycoside phosphotransferase (APT) family kinase protein